MTNQEHFVEVAVARACKVVTCDLYLPGNNESKKKQSRSRFPLSGLLCSEDACSRFSYPTSQLCTITLAVFVRAAFALCSATASAKNSMEYD